MPKKQVRDPTKIGLSALFTGAGIYGIYYAYGQPCASSLNVGSGLLEQSVQIPEVISRALCISSDPTLIIITTLSSIAMSVGGWILIRSIIGD